MSISLSAVAARRPGAARVVVLEAVRDGGPVSRAQLARATGLAPPTITGVVRQLLDERVVTEVGPVAPGADGATRSGPPGTGLVVNPDLAFALGVDVGYRSIRVLACDVTGRVRGRAEAAVGLADPHERGLAEIGALSAAALAEAGADAARVLSAGVAVRGPVDTRARRVSGSAEAGSWAGLAASDLERLLGCRVHLENDANLAALGEGVYGVGRPARTSLTVKLHSGIGLGIIVDGRLVTGWHGGAGELGHVTVDRRGRLCRCGKRGCLDTVAAIPAVLAAAAPRLGHVADDRAGDLGAGDLGELLDRVRDGDTALGRLVHDAAAEVGGALAVAALLVAPELVVVTGALARSGDAVLGPIRAALRASAIPHAGTLPEVRLGELGELATPLGAVALCLRDAAWAPARPVV